MKFIIFITLFLHANINFSAGQQCNENGMRKFDTTFAKLLTLGSSGRRFPENKEGELKLFCDQTTEYLKDIDKYKNKCMKDTPKQATGVIVYSVKNTINQLCKKDSKRLTDLIASTPCANKAKNEIDVCYTNLIDSFQGAIHATEKSRVPHMCCQYLNLFHCISERLAKNRKDSCNDFHIDNINEFIRTLFGNVVDLICGDFGDSSDKCEKLEPTPKKKKSQRRTKSFMVPMINILASIGNLEKSR